MEKAKKSKLKPKPKPLTRARYLRTNALILFIASVLPVRSLEIDRQYGESSFKFLKLPLSPRIVALGGAGAALADGAGELDINPAAPALDSGHLIVGRGYPFSEFQSTSSSMTWSIPTARYRILLNARYLGFDNIPGYDDVARPTTAYGAHTLKVQAGLASVYKNLAWGTTVNFAGNSIADANYATAMVNAGLRYPVLRGLHVGLSVLNADFWSSRAHIDGNQAPFPPTALQAGLAYSHDLGSLSGSIALDARTRNDEQIAFPMGAEIAWHKMVIARIGFPVAEQEPGVSAGLGIRWSHYLFQYAFQSHANLGPGHYWTLDIGY
jgi:hypothetical protein